MGNDTPVLADDFPEDPTPEADSISGPVASAPEALVEPPASEAAPVPTGRSVGPAERGFGDPPPPPAPEPTVGTGPAMPEVNLNASPLERAPGDPPSKT